MISCLIQVNGRYYAGESDEAYPANVGGKGWHVANHGSLNRLNFVDDSGSALRVIGKRNLSSHLDRILRRVGDGKIDAREIVIQIEKGENPMSAIDFTDTADELRGLLTEAKAERDNMQNAIRAFIRLGIDGDLNASQSPWLLLDLALSAGYDPDNLEWTEPKANK